MHLGRFAASLLLHARQCRTCVELAKQRVHLADVVLLDELPHVLPKFHLVDGLLAAFGPRCDELVDFDLPGDEHAAEAHGQRHL